MSSKLKVINKLPQFISRQEMRAARALNAALIIGGTEAAVLTPIGDTSNLINSQFAFIDRDGSRLVGRAGYTVSYALPVHDPNHRQTFRRASAEKEFLKKGFERAKPNIAATIKRELKT